MTPTQLSGDNAGYQPKGNPLVALLVGLAMAWMYLHFFASKAYLELEIDTDAQKRDFVNVYWASEGGFFSEQDKNRVRINRSQQDYNLFIGGLGESRKLRIDPMEYAGELSIRKVSITQFGYEPIVLENEQELLRLLPANQIDSAVYENGGLKIRSTGGDPQLVLEIEPVKTYWGFLPLQHVMSLIGIFIVVWLSYGALSGIFNRLVFVPAALLMIVVMVATMASVTGEHVHPDETVHMGAVAYYGEHFLPPPVDAEDIAHTFSIYGYSRLTSFEIYYQLAGYFTRVLEPFKLSTLLSARYFGVVLLIFLLGFAVKRPDFRYFLLPLLVSAQAWYLFSYANSDLFGLFLSIVMGYQLAYRDSLFNQFLSQENPHWFWPKAVWLGLLCGSLLLIKSNYYFFVLFLGLFLIWRLALGEFPNQKQFWYRASLLVVIGLSFYGVRYGWDVAVNGPDSTRIEAQIEKHAGTLFKPSTELDEKHAYLYMKERGVSLEAIIEISRWAEKTFITAFGAYGFTQFLSAETFYDLVRYSGVLILVLMLFGVLVKGPPSAHWLFLIGLGCSVLLIGAAFWHSWTVSFQPQGRYMMPILPIIGVVYYQLKAYLPRALILSLTCFLFLLGMYSFIFIGLHDIPKLDYVL